MLIHYFIFQILYFWKTNGESSFKHKNQSEHKKFISSQVEQLIYVIWALLCFVESFVMG